MRELGISLAKSSINSFPPLSLYCRRITPSAQLVKYLVNRYEFFRVGLRHANANLFMCVGKFAFQFGVMFFQRLECLHSSVGVRYDRVAEDADSFDLDFDHIADVYLVDAGAAAWDDVAGV